MTQHWIQENNCVKFEDILIKTEDMVQTRHVSIYSHCRAGYITLGLIKTSCVEINNKKFEENPFKGTGDIAMETQSDYHEFPMGGRQIY